MYLFNNITASIAVCGLVVLAVSSCSNDEPTGGDTEYSGVLSAQFAADTNVSQTSPQGRSAGPLGEITASDLEVTLVSADGGVTVNELWPSAADVPASATYPVGEYTLTARYGSADTDGFDDPAYFATKQITISKDQTTQASLTATRQKGMMSVTFSDVFRAYFSSWSVSMASAMAPDAQIAYSQTETRPVHFRPATVTVVLTVAGPDGTTKTIDAGEVEIKAAYHHHLTFDLNQGQAGTLSLQVLFDDTLVEQDVEIDLNDLIDPPYRP